MWKEFKEFATRGNVLDMAVGVIIGDAFGKIVTSLVNDMIMPPIGLLISKVDFAQVCFDLQHQRFTTLATAKAEEATTINIGAFLNNVIDFIIVAFAIFLVIRSINRLNKPAPAPPAPATKDCPYCCSAIAAKATSCPSCTATLS